MNKAFAVAYGKDNDFSHYQLVACWADNQTCCGIVKPWSGTQRQCNEGTFSPAGPFEWLSYHGGGTEEIWMGSRVTERYPAAIDALKFVEDGFFFHLNSFYSMPGYLIRSEGMDDDEMIKRNNEASNLSSVAAAFRLIREASRELETYCPEMHVVQVGCFNNGVECFRDVEGYPVNEDDYLVKELSHPNRKVGFVKVG